MNKKNGEQIKMNKIMHVTLLLIITFAFSGCEQFDKLVGLFNKSGSSVEQEEPVFAVNTIAAVQGQIQDYITFSGDIVSGATVDAYPEAAGKITQLFVAVGRWVNRGDPIAEIDPSRPGMTFMTSTATAPISGTIVMLPAQVGMTVSQAVPLARIAGGSGFEIKLSIAERFISKIAMNLACEITLDAWPGDIFYGNIREISPTIELSSRTMEVRVNVRDTQSKLKPGMFARVRIITERKENIVKIPASAVINRFGEQYVYVVQKDPGHPEFEIVRKRIITPGILIEGVMEIQSGLAPDEEVVVRGHTLLDDGSRVNVIERVTPLSQLSGGVN